MKDKANRKSCVCISGVHTFTTTLSRFACNTAEDCTVVQFKIETKQEAVFVGFLMFSLYSSCDENLNVHSACVYEKTF